MSGTDRMEIMPAWTELVGSDVTTYPEVKRMVLLVDAEGNMCHGWFSYFDQRNLEGFWSTVADDFSIKYWANITINIPE